ncbi:glycosyl hydrolase family 8 [Neorhizobium sp. NPDC001467]|uniref:glycosyl hydrolase family 8 n=1 Tax=Neorhizobium sp. NPDC001467 TaxID=3390595 RepID=UPI003CFE92D7
MRRGPTLLSCASALLAGAIVLVSGLSHPARAGGVPAAQWQAYKQKFLDGSGRIIDNGNGNISHSEGQGYGLILAYLANEEADFDQIWSFTRTELLLRDDGLAVWKWDPNAKPHVVDTNNASDGDLLIAYGLALGGAAWNRADYTAAARAIARALLKSAVVEKDGHTVLLPGLEGFGENERADGPVINPSYWVYEALPIMNMLAPSDRWQKLSDDGKALLGAMRFGPRKLPADWVSIAQQPRPAEGFAPEYGYNAVRIPLYLMRAGVADQSLLTWLAQATSASPDATSTFDIPSGNVKDTLSDPGYRLVNHMVGCVVSGTKLPDDLRRFEPLFYYPSTLQLLGLAFITEKHPECL